MGELFDNKYLFIKELGAGGFGRVFLAKEEISGRFVAIKQLNNKNQADQTNIIHEIQAVSKFNHPNIVSYHHHFWQDGLLFLVMEYCAGGSLRDKLKNKKQPSTDVLSWIQTLTECLHLVHKQGIIHHDIKPDNILFTESDVIKISDFGIANLAAGTRAYMSPESLNWDIKAVKDPRVDIYALGVTLMESLSGQNPFFLQSKEQIIDLHEKADFPIKQLPNWQQEIILKAINKVPEMRFQEMVDMEEAIIARSVPVIFAKDVIQVSKIVDDAEKALKSKKWQRAWYHLDYARKKYPENVSVWRVLGKYYLLRQNIFLAKRSIEKALSLNPRLDLQKDLGWINLEYHNYPIAISLLTDHLHRHPSDYEAYNLLLRCYYETNRYEPAMELAKMLMESNSKLPCFANNYYISFVMDKLGQVVFPNTILKAPENPFVDYNFSVVLDNKTTHNLDKPPTLKSKLMFMDFHFNELAKNILSVLESTDDKASLTSFEKTIVKIGREGFDVNDIQVPGGSSISRRHCLIVNCKNDVWIYDLSSTGTYLNGEKIKSKSPILGLNKLKLGDFEYTITTDKTMLL